MQSYILIYPLGYIIIEYFNVSISVLLLDVNIGKHHLELVTYVKITSIIF